MKFICAFSFFLAVQSAHPAGDVISLAGKWRFDLDRSDSGIIARWYDRPLAHTIHLPGSLPEQGIGDDVTVQTPWTGDIVDRSFFDAPEFAKDREPGHVRIPFWLQPEKYYAGVSWFQRDINIPAAWRNRRAVLFLERPHWETQIWMDGRMMGTNDSLATPHEYSLGLLPPGRHSLSIRVDNRRIVDVGENSHCVSDHTQGNWNGIVGRVELRSTPLVWMDDLQVYPRLADKSITVKGRLGNRSDRAGGETVRLVVLDGRKKSAEKNLELTNTADGAEFETSIPLGENAKTWDEFHPVLYTLTASLAGATRAVSFGLREITTQGAQFLINGRKTFIRGTLECCIFPKTGHPPTEVKEWERVLRIARAHGLNLLRFHSYCPPEAAFIAGDELGFYFQVETCWANQSITLGDGQPVDQWVYDETSRILKAYGNHPSFLFMPYGNEPGGKHAAEYLAKYVAHFKSLDSRRLWTGGSGWPQISENQFHVTPDPRIQAWGAGLKSRINAKPPETETDYRTYVDKRGVPVISHEIGQWCVYPDFEEMPKYTGYLKPRNFEIFRDTLAAHGMGKLARSFLLASGKLQTLCYKEDIESALRTPGMGGFELLDLHDFPGQGTALVGVLDPFWDDKGYVTAAEYRRFCNIIVPLARLPKRVFTTDEKLEAKIEVANFGDGPIHGATANWKLVTTGNKLIGEGGWPRSDIPVGNGIPLGAISADLKNVEDAAQCRLIVSVHGNTGRFENDWDVWVYPTLADAPPPNGILLTPRWDAEAQTTLRAGGKVLLTIPAKAVRNFGDAPVALGFSSIFWNTAWTHRQPPTTLGLLCDPKHPALAEFPTDYYSNWQWWYLIHRAGALRLDLLPGGLEPIVRVIDDWVTARPLALVIEGKAGAGKIIVCGFDLTDGASDPVSRQMRQSLLHYMASGRFTPATELTEEQIGGLMNTNKPAGLRGVRRITADSEQPGYDAENAIDGDAQTFWHTSWDNDAPEFPHELTIELDTPQALAGFVATPRQDGNRNGWIKDYAFYTSLDGESWGNPVAKGVFPAGQKPKTVNFASPVTARFVRLTALSGYADGPWASLAELNLIQAQHIKEP
jgi:hypothetical protein